MHLQPRLPQRLLHCAPAGTVSLNDSPLLLYISGPLLLPSFPPALQEKKANCACHLARFMFTMKKKAALFGNYKREMDIRKSPFYSELCHSLARELKENNFAFLCIHVFSQKYRVGICSGPTDSHFTVAPAEHFQEANARLHLNLG